MQSPEILAVRFNELIQFEVAWRHDSLTLHVLFNFLFTLKTSCICIDVTFN